MSSPFKGDREGSIILNDNENKNLPAIHKHVVCSNGKCQ